MVVQHAHQMLHNFDFDITKNLTNENNHHIRCIQEMFQIKKYVKVINFESDTDNFISIYETLIK